MRALLRYCATALVISDSPPMCSHTLEVHFCEMAFIAKPSMKGRQSGLRRSFNVESC